MSEQPAPRHHRPLLPGAGRFETLTGDDDPAVRSEAADRCATLLVRGAHDTGDEQVVSRVVHLAETEGLDTLADLWSGSPPDSLAGCLWRLYLLRSWVYADPAAAAQEFDPGRPPPPAHPGCGGRRRARGTAGGRSGSTVAETAVRPEHRRVRSFVHQRNRLTEGQAHA